MPPGDGFFKGLPGGTLHNILVVSHIITLHISLLSLYTYIHTYRYVYILTEDDWCVYVCVYTCFVGFVTILMTVVLIVFALIDFLCVKVKTRCDLNVIRGWPQVTVSSLLYMAMY